MIILIGGAGSSGKTLMAQKLLEIYKIPYLSLDHLKMGLIRGLKSCYINAEDNNEKITNFLWPIVKGIIMANIENNQNLIVEGCYFPFNLINYFSNFYRLNIILFYIVMTESYIRDNLSVILRKRNIIEKRTYPEERTLEKIISENNLVKSNCDKNKTKYFEIESDYENDLKKAYEWVYKKMKSDYFLQ